MNKSDIKNILMSMRTQDNEAQVNYWLGRVDMLSDKYLILGNHMVIGNFGGYPSITIPSGFIDNMPVGINITGRVCEDDLVLNIANKLENSMEYANQIAKEMK